MLAVGEHLWGEVDDRTRRMSTGLAGGIGCSHEDVCGLISGGAMIIGAQYGRTSGDEDDEECNRLATLYRERFLAHYGHTQCQAIRDTGYGDDGQWPCSVVAAQATRILLGLLAEDK